VCHPSPTRHTKASEILTARIKPLAPLHSQRWQGLVAIPRRHVGLRAAPRKDGYRAASDEPSKDQDLDRLSPVRPRHCPTEARHRFDWLGPTCWRPHRFANSIRSRGCSERPVSPLVAVEVCPEICPRLQRTPPNSTARNGPKPAQSAQTGPDRILSPGNRGSSHGSGASGSASGKRDAASRRSSRYQPGTNPAAARRDCGVLTPTSR
jgi:hypothetical protein